MGLYCIFLTCAHMKTSSRREEIIAARERGVIFDIGHGKGSFGYATAEVMLQSGFSPDCISSDVHVLSIVGPAHDQLVTMSKFLALGMSLNQVITASTSEPAKAVGHPELGHLGVGLGYLHGYKRTKASFNGEGGIKLLKTRNFE